MDWIRVSEKYLGIIIREDAISSLGPSWTYGWDVDGGVIWNAQALKSLTRYEGLPKPVGVPVVRPEKEISAAYERDDDAEAVRLSTEFNKMADEQQALFEKQQLGGAPLKGAHDYYGTKPSDWVLRGGKKILKQIKNSYYRGFSTSDIERFLDKKGNLVIPPGRDDMFGRRMDAPYGVSVTGGEKQARTYAMRSRDQLNREAANTPFDMGGDEIEALEEHALNAVPVVVRIPKPAFDAAIKGKKTLLGQESGIEGVEGETRVVTKGYEKEHNIVIPKGKFEIFEFEPIARAEERDPTGMALMDTLEPFREGQFAEGIQGGAPLRTGMSSGRFMEMTAKAATMATASLGRKTTATIALSSPVTAIWCWT